MLIVSAYYDIPSKQPKSFYLEHIRRFFEYITQPICFFTDQENYDILKHVAGDNVMFQIQPYEDMTIFETFPVEFWKDRIARDVEKYHTWQLGAIWCNKPEFVKKAVEMYNTYDWYMWVDAGCVRTDAWKDTLSGFGKKVDQLSPAVYIQLLNELPYTRRFFSYRSSSDYDVFIAGSHCLFHRNYIDQFTHYFYNTLREYDDNCQSLMSDQHIMSTMVYDHTFIIPVRYNHSIRTVNEWFFFFSIF